MFPMGSNKKHFFFVNEEYFASCIVHVCKAARCVFANALENCFGESRARDVFGALEIILV